MSEIRDSYEIGHRHGYAKAVRDLAKVRGVVEPTVWESEGDWLYAYRDGVCYAEVNVAVAEDVDGLAREMAEQLNRATTGVGD